MVRRKYMQALIHKNEIAQTGWRVCQVELNIFPVAEDMFWIDCADNVIADQFWYDPTDKTIKPNPLQEQPKSKGVQTL
jgi:hypothetical protein